jgi:hypothetical protein
MTSPTTTTVEVLQKARAGEWLPIETAPKDGTIFLTGSYNGKGEWCVEVWCGTALADEQAIIARGFFDDCPHLMWDPTHWMPLPEPPADRAIDLAKREAV